MRKVMIVALSGAAIIGMGACSAPTETNAQPPKTSAPPPPAPAAPEAPLPPEDGGEETTQPEIAVTAESVVYAEEMSPAYGGLMEDYPTALRVTVENTGSEPLEISDLTVYGLDADGNHSKRGRSDSTPTTRPP